MAKSRPRAGRFVFTAMLLPCLFALAGCNARESYEVSGRVQMKDGSPVPGAVRIIRFEPTADTTATIRKAASATIAQDGTFELFTRKPGDGVIPGRYAVTFTVLTKPMGGVSLIKEEYTRGDLTPYDIVVDEDKEDLLYEIEGL